MRFTPLATLFAILTVLAGLAMINAPSNACNPNAPGCKPKPQCGPTVGTAAPNC